MEEDIRIPKAQLFAFYCCMGFSLTMGIYAILVLVLSCVAFFIPSVGLIRDTIINFVGTYIPGLRFYN